MDHEGDRAHGRVEDPLAAPIGALDAGGRPETGTMALVQGMLTAFSEALGSFDRRLAGMEGALSAAVSTPDPPVSPDQLTAAVTAAVERSLALGRQAEPGAAVSELLEKISS